MSERLKKLVGDELYGKIEEAAKAQNIKVKDIDIIANNFVTKSRFDEINDELKTTRGKVVTYENTNTDIQKLLKGANAENVQDLLTKYDSLNTSHINELAGKDKEIANIKKTSMIKEHLLNQGAKHTKLLMSSIDLDKIQVDGDKLIGVNDIVKDLKTEYKELFIEKETNGKPPKNTNTNTGGSDGGSDSTGNIFTSLLNGSQL
jgi:hypothetical protein